MPHVHVGVGAGTERNVTCMQWGNIPDNVDRDDDNEHVPAVYWTVLRPVALPEMLVDGDAVSM